MQSMLKLSVEVLSWMIIALWSPSWISSNGWSKDTTYELRLLLYVLSRLNLYNVVENKVERIIDLIFIVVSILCPKSRMYSPITLYISMIIHSIMSTSSSTNLQAWISSFWVLLSVLLNGCSIIINCIWTDATALNQLLFHLRFEKLSFNFCILISFLLWVRC